MPIHIYCSDCRKRSSVGSSFCDKCGVAFGKRKQYRIEVCHKGRRESRMADTLADAREIEHALVTQLKLNEAGVKKQKRITISALCSARLEHISHDRSASYIRETGWTHARILAAWGDAPIDKIQKAEIEAYIKSRGVTRAAAYDLSIIKALFNFAIDRGLLEKSPCIGVESVKIDKKKKYIPPKEDIERVMAAANPEQRVYLLAVKNTLGRVREVNNLTWDDVDLVKRELTLWTRKKKRGAHTPRHIPMLDELAEELEIMPRPSPYVFTNRITGTKYDYRKKLMHGLCKRANVPPFTFHAFRHYGASTLAARGAPLSDIQALLGHDQISTTSLYIQSLMASTRASIKLLED